MGVWKKFMDLQKLCEIYERIIQISFFERSSKDEMLIDAIESKRGVIMVKYNQLKIKGELKLLQRKNNFN